MAKHNRQVGLLACLWVSLFLGLLPSVAIAEPLWATYMPPELTYADDLRQKITIPGQVSINHGSLNQLMALPGLDEEIALKIMRNRPFEGVQDFYKKMPGLSRKNIDRLIQQLQPKLLFN